MCKYCEQGNKTEISGAYFKILPTKRTEAKLTYCKPRCFILKGEEDEKAGLMIDSLETCYYIDINYCPMCGRKLGEEKC